ncbi:LOW QUALITY PROTEIN: galactoside 2-alpha-L-fucosyltransferase-like [Primulina tabacum]|uniref:LOW QUALITY PROTEIN: galactoside 2-alpha-L-fucosyltransferase-like n=1 Tax=Primulina tabacum TaxID=48773 RepID=UPI003F5A25C3
MNFIPPWETSFAATLTQMMKRLSKSTASHSDEASTSFEYGHEPVSHSFECINGLNPVKLMVIFVALLMGSSVLFFVSVVWRDPPSDILWTVEERDLQFQAQKATLKEDNLLHLIQEPNDELTGGLLPTGFEEQSCLSRHQFLLYRNETRQPSRFLLSKLRSYETQHEKCGPYTELYNKTLKNLKSGQYSSASDCNYIVWISFSGLGNRMLTLASAFLYALLTNRILLVDSGVDMADLFCEPFPKVSWFLPSDFPLNNQFDGFNRYSNESNGNLLKRNYLGNLNGSTLPSYVYLHLVHDYDDQDKLFFCNEDQTFLQKIPWLIMKTNNYFIPSLFLIPSFEQDLHKLFPDKETVFHFLGRYLFHPTNPVWGLISRYYEAYLSQADEKVGIRIRVFHTETGPFKHVLDQILACTMEEDILPQINRKNSMIRQPDEKQKTVAVLMTSLSYGYFEEIRNLYWEYPTMKGEVVAVYQPSHEEYQQTDKLTHNRKALTEIYLLSLTDKLVTSSWSTFGYVAQGLGGLKPWIIYKPDNESAPDLPCCRAMSMEPCFHAPPFYDCNTKRGMDTGAVVPHVRHCEDMSWGLKLVEQDSEL